MPIWNSRAADHERWWFSEELSALRREAFRVYEKPVDAHWHEPVADAAMPTAANGSA